MKIAKYWAKESDKATNAYGLEFHLVAWSGSNQSLQSAKEKAKAKLALWIAKLGRDECLIDPYPYGRDEAIREELIEEIKDSKGALIAAITRNRYGALVLNSANVMFIDVDLPIPIRQREPLLKQLFSIFSVKKKQAIVEQGIRAELISRFVEFQSRHQDLALRIYETAAGFRLVVLNKTMDPTSDESQSIMKELESDNLYQLLCQNQQCYRARLTPKPWRCGYKSAPRWFPRVKAEHIKEYDAWVQTYEERSSKYGICRKVDDLGITALDTTVQQILDVHDKYTLNSESKVLA